MCFWQSGCLWQPHPANVIIVIYQLNVTTLMMWCNFLSLGGDTYILYFRWGLLRSHLMTHRTARTRRWASPWLQRQQRKGRHWGCKEENPETQKHWTLASKKNFSWRVCGANSVTISTSWFSSIAHKGVFRFITMLQNECISTKMQTWTRLWWLECYFSLVKVEWIWSRWPTPEKANKWINKSFCKSGEVI